MLGRAASLQFSPGLSFGAAGGLELITLAELLFQLAKPLPGRINGNIGSL
jgi:hypothetical protein